MFCVMCLGEETRPSMRIAGRSSSFPVTLVTWGDRIQVEEIQACRDFQNGYLASGSVLNGVLPSSRWVDRWG